MLESSAHSIARGVPNTQRHLLFLVPLGKKRKKKKPVSCFWSKTAKAQTDVRTHPTFGPALGVGLRWKQPCPQPSVGAYLPQALLVQTRIQHPFTVSCMPTFCQMLGTQWRAQVKRFWIFRGGPMCCRHRHSIRVTEAGLEHGWTVMQTIPASVSVTIALINHPDMQCSGARIWVQFQGVAHHIGGSQGSLWSGRSCCIHNQETESGECHCSAYLVLYMAWDFSPENGAAQNGQDSPI